MIATDSDPIITCNDADISTCIQSLADQIHSTIQKDTVLIGILDYGHIVAKRLAHHLLQDHKAQLPVGALDISLYDNSKLKDANYVSIQRSDIPFSISSKTVILVTDHLGQGHDIRGALATLYDFGNPTSILLATLIDTNECKLPIFAHFVGQRLSLPKNTSAQVFLSEIDGFNEVHQVPASY